LPRSVRTAENVTGSTSGCVTSVVPRSGNGAQVASQGTWATHVLVALDASTKRT
jgi:hypothetical protein